MARNDFNWLILKIIYMFIYACKCSPNLLPRANMLNVYTLEAPKYQWEQWQYRAQIGPNHKDEGLDMTYIKKTSGGQLIEVICKSGKSSIMHVQAIEQYSAWPQIGNILKGLIAA